MDNKDLLKQYVNTGLKIPEYQFAKLNDNLKRSNIRLRLMRFNLSEYEYRLAPNDVKEKYLIEDLLGKNKYVGYDLLEVTPKEIVDKYLQVKMDKGIKLTDDDFPFLSPETQIKTITSYLKQGLALSKRIYSVAPDNLKWEYIQTILKKYNRLPNELYADTPDNIRLKYIEGLIDNGTELTDREYDYLPNSSKERYANAVINSDDKFLELTEHNIMDLPDDYGYRYVLKLFKNHHEFEFSEEEFDEAPEKLKNMFLNAKVEYGKLLRDFEYENASEQLKRIYVKKHSGLKLANNEQ